MAATIHVHVGQCGNQLGERFWTLAAKENGGVGDGSSGSSDEGGVSAGPRPRQAQQDGDAAPFQGSSPLFHAYDGKATAVFVDSECKVLDRVRANPALGRVLRRDNFCSDSSGRANNWAMGFDASLRELEKGEGLFHSAVEALRREMERVDCLQGVVLHHSLAGGTGSGLGSAMLQYLREAAPALNLTTVSVAPFASGDCATQWYNAAFTLHALAADADAVILRDNDQLLQHHLLHAAVASTAGGGKLVQQRAAASKASMPALNDSLSRDLACLFFPTFNNAHPPSTSSTSSSRSSPLLLLPPTPTPWDARGLAQACCPFTHAKFLDLRSSWSLPPHLHIGHAGHTTTSTSFRAAAAQGRRTGAAATYSSSSSTSSAWPGLAQAVTAAFPSVDVGGAPVATLAAQVTLRGVDPSALPFAAASSSSSSSSAAAAADPRAARKARRQPQPPPSSTSGSTSPNPYLPPATAPPANPALAALLGEQLPRSLRLAPWRNTNHRHRGVAAVYSVSVESPSNTNANAGAPGMAVCANRSDAGAAVGRVLARAAAMAEHRAYLHWYERHGVGVDDFAAAFDGLRRVVEEYGELRGGVGGCGDGEWAAAEQQRAWHGREALRAVRDFAVN